MTSKKTALGYKCDCGFWNECTNYWAAAHWDDELFHTCEGCGVMKCVQGGKCLGDAMDFDYQQDE